MRLPTIRGTIKRRILLNFRADPAVIQPLLPPPFRPKLHGGQAVVGVCLIRLENIRPIGVPSFLGINSENAAHRIAIEWTDSSGAPREGVFIPRRDTGSILNRLAGGRIFPGEHQGANFNVRDDGRNIDFLMKSHDGRVEVRFKGENSTTLPSNSIFAGVEHASSFFEQGSLGYSVTKNSARLDALELRTFRWNVSPLDASGVYSSWFNDETHFPKTAIQFDHALIMRDIQHEWHQGDEV